jgi:serine beta-lactamase-like protein LACTB, mitochondrial
MRAIIGLTLLAGLSVLAFKLFEPVFVYRTGWADMPRQFPMGQAQVADDWREAAAELDTMLREARAKLNAPSLSAAISVNGQIVWANAAGYENIDLKTPASTATAYRMGSTSKAVTSVMAGILIDKGAIELDAPLSRYMPDLSAPMAGLTVRQVMSHTGGVRNYQLCFCFPAWENLSTTHFGGSQRETLRAYEADPLIFKPGEGFAYTSLGFNAVGGVIEAAAGKRFGDYLKVAVTGPLGMTATTIEDGTPGPARAVPYDTSDGRLKQEYTPSFKPAFPVDNSNKYPSGGMIGSPSDMTKLGQAMIAATLFSAATRDRLIDPQELKDGTPNDQGYALGWRYNPKAELFGGARVTRRYGHHGTAQGATSFFQVYPDEGVVVSVMMNKGQQSLDALSAEAMPIVERVFVELDRRAAAAKPPQ